MPASPPVAIWRHGPYHRLQGQEKNALMSESRTVGGTERRGIFGNVTEKAKSYTGHLPAGKSGIEFYTCVAPDGGTSPGNVTWSRGLPGVSVFQTGDPPHETLAGIPVWVVRQVPA